MKKQLVASLPDPKCEYVLGECSCGLCGWQHLCGVSAMVTMIDIKGGNVWLCDAHVRPWLANLDLSLDDVLKGLRQ